MEKINLAEKFSLFDEYWTPKVLAESNEQLVKIAKGQGELVWHQHDHEDELFIVFKGQLTLKLKEKYIVLNLVRCLFFQKVFRIALMLKK